MYLQDVSCNEITHLPSQLGDLDSLRELDVRRNLLVELPVGEYSNLNVKTQVKGYYLYPPPHYSVQ